jgi:general secretion pathway protein G
LGRAGGVESGVRFLCVNRRSRFRGFAAIGLAVAVAAYVLVDFYSGRERRIAARTQISNLEAVLEIYRMDNGSYPTTKQGLRAAVVPSENAPGWSHYPKGYFERQLRDPWGRAFEYRSPGVNNLTGFDLWSFGADGALGGNGFDADIFNGRSSQSD